MAFTNWDRRRNRPRGLQPISRDAAQTDSPCAKSTSFFLDALASGLPPCAGVALGFDRLVMVAARAERIDDVVTFPYERA